MRLLQINMLYWDLIGAAAAAAAGGGFVVEPVVAVGPVFPCPQGASGAASIWAFPSTVLTIVRRASCARGGGRHGNAGG